MVRATKAKQTCLRELRPLNNVLACRILLSNRKTTGQIIPCRDRSARRYHPCSYTQLSFRLHIYTQLSLTQTLRYASLSFYKIIKLWQLAQCSKAGSKTCFRRSLSLWSVIESFFIESFLIESSLCKAHLFCTSPFQSSLFILLSHQFLIL